MHARIVVLDSPGAQAAYREVEMAGHTSLAVQIHDLLAEAGSAVTTGSVLVIPEPVAGMPIGAQLSIASRTGATCDLTKTGRTAITEQMYRDESLPDRGAVGVSLTTSGTPGDLITYGFAAYNDDANIIFTGIPVGPVNLFPGTTFHPEVAISIFPPRQPK